MSEPPQKKSRSEGTLEANAAPSSLTPSSAPNTKTVYVSCKHIHSRGELVNAFFYLHRAELGLGEDEGSTQGWYPAEGQLHRAAPLEVVHVKNSKRPYFLVEWRYPTSEELARRKSHREGEDDDDVERHPGEEAAAAMRTVDADALHAVTEKLLKLGQTEGLTHKEAPVVIQAALPGVTVASERAKLLLRDEEKKKAASASAGGSSSGGAQAAKKAAPPATTTSFVPRAVRRR